MRWWGYSWGLTLDYHVGRQNKTKETRILVKKHKLPVFQIKISMHIVQN